MRSAKARGAQALVRQAHFRFVDQQGGDAHHPFCEFSGDDNAGVWQPDSLLNFGSEKSQETRNVRVLVCKGIELGLFNQGTVRTMRQWFFDIKAASRFQVSATPASISWARTLQRHPHHHRWQFHPAQADLPAFDWAAAAKHQFTQENLPLFDFLKGAPREDAEWKRANAPAEKNLGHEVFNVTTLKPYYEASLTLCTFVARNGGISFGKVLPEYYRFKGAPLPLLALCALVLFTSAWDMNVAIAKFAKLLSAPTPTDYTLGNVIGLNPFHEYAAWNLVVIAAELAAKSPIGLDYSAQLAAIESRLRE
ncbi:hypothetical protein [Rhizobium leguminosarum]|uniref:hypothetical protein n=1 Tax=Rhizobium leguminosarum TaxID=384 RepID=UPI0021BBEFA2|nr:hypothetical protein [Rhizobium leguminosarum]